MICKHVKKTLDELIQVDIVAENIAQTVFHCFQQRDSNLVPREVDGIHVAK